MNTLEKQGWTIEVHQALERLISESKSGDLAVFDADGTLWADDLGDDFLQILIANQSLINPPPGDIFREYQARCAQDKSAGYLFAVQLMAGLSETDIRQLSQSFFEREYRQRIFDPMKQLISVLIQSGLEVWAVSATNQWSAEVGVAYLGIPAKQVIGMRVKVENGLLTAAPELPINNAAGKVESIQKYIGKVPMIAGGNSMSDHAMLDYSSQLSLVINPDPQLAQIAREKHWLVQYL